MNIYPASLESLVFPREGRRRRISSYDRKGGNDDRVHIASGDTKVIAEMDLPGMITHIWITIATDNREIEQDYLRKMVLRCYWDNETTPSVEVPVGDFFGMGHAQCRNFVSSPLQMSPQDGKGFNCWFAMPYECAKIEILNECDASMTVYYYIDYEEYLALPAEMLRFHAFWNRENPTKGMNTEDQPNAQFLFGGNNVTSRENYVILGCIL